MERPQAHKRGCTKIVQLLCLTALNKMIPVATLILNFQNSQERKFCFTGIEKIAIKKGLTFTFLFYIAGKHLFACFTVCYLINNKLIMLLKLQS